mgnify:CR=1 FL=1
MKKTRAFLKWAGGKYSLVEEIAERLPAGRVLLEPFVGAGSVFLNTDYDAYVLNDINPDLIGLYNHLKRQPDNFIREARKLFVAEHNHKTAYYRLRTQFNQTDDSFERAVLFSAVPVSESPRVQRSVSLQQEGRFQRAVWLVQEALFPGERAVGLRREGTEGHLHL